MSFYDWIQREENLLWLSWQQHALFLLRELNPCPAKGNNTMCKQRFIIGNNQDYRWAKIEYLDSGLQTFEHWSILKHIRDHHEPGEILALIRFNLFQRQLRGNTNNFWSNHTYLTLLPRIKTCSNWDIFPSYKRIMKASHWRAINIDIREGNEDYHIYHGIYKIEKRKSQYTYIISSTQISFSL